MPARADKIAGEKITVKATLKGERFTESGIVCEIELPAIDSGLASITCAFEDDVAPLRVGFLFGLEAETFDVEGKKLGEIRAKKAFWRGQNRELGRYICRGEAVDLTYTQFVGGEDESPHFITSFHLTPSLLLEPFTTTEQHYQDGAKVNTHRAAEYDITDLPKTRFESHLVYEKDANRAFSALRRLAAVWNSDVPGDIEKQVHGLEIFLTLASFAERRRCVCYALTQYGDGKIVQHYRGNITIPEDKPSYTSNETLIGPDKFRAFMADCYPRLLQSPYGPYLRQAMMKLGAHDSRALESAFIAHFAGLENLLNAYREAKGRTGILPKEEWKQFEGDVRSFIKGHASFQADSAKRGLLYNKLSELNRPALGTALAEFVAEEKIDLGDLWPVAGPIPDGVTLYQIRNQIVHGQLLPHSGLQALAVAQAHLQWVLERCILGVLKWDVGESRVSARFLPIVGPVKWIEESKLLKTSFAGAHGELDQPTQLFDPR